MISVNWRATQIFPSREDEIKPNQLERLKNLFPSMVFTVNEFDKHVVKTKGGAFVASFGESCTYQNALETLRKHSSGDQLARNIVAMLFWRWRSTLAICEIKGSSSLITHAGGMEMQAHNDFVAAYNAYYGKWD